MSRVARREPLRVRPGARFECAGDGLCCADVHAIGPLSDEDREMLTVISEAAVERHDGGDDAVLIMRSDTGRCVFWTEDGCVIHNKLGGHLKPTPCIQFPFALTATPTGGRVSTQHRCPCRTLGSRPAILADDVRACLSNAEGELKHEHAVFESVRWSADEAVPFGVYEEREAPLLAELTGGHGLSRALQAEPFPPLRGSTWLDVANEMLAFHGAARAAVAARWFGDAIAFLVSREPQTEQGRPWADAFERGEARIADPVTPNRVFGDWLADEVWSMRWTAYGSLARARTELATRLAIARRIAACLDQSNPKAENVSAAEAVMIVDVIGTTAVWDKTQEAIGEP